MGEHTNISWCDHTFNPWIGCTKVSEACEGCYAEAMMDLRYGRVTWGKPGQRGTYSRTSEQNWNQVLRWHKSAMEAGTRPFVFCASLADVFDNQVPAEWRKDLFDLIRATPHLVWLLLTKRPQNIIKLSEEAGGLPDNVALGTTAENQKRFDETVVHLVRAKWHLKPLFVFLSIEPLLGPIEIGNWAFYVDWIITGGETDQGKHKARPWNPQWERDIRDHCEDIGVPFHKKQNGEWASVSEVDGEGEHHTFPDGRTVRRVGRNKSGRALDGKIHDARPKVPALEAA